MVQVISSSVDLISTLLIGAERKTVAQKKRLNATLGKDKVRLGKCTMSYPDSVPLSIKGDLAC